MNKNYFKLLLVFCSFSEFMIASKSAQQHNGSKSQSVGSQTEQRLPSTICGVVINPNHFSKL